MLQRSEELDRSVHAGKRPPRKKIGLETLAAAENAMADTTSLIPFDSVQSVSYTHLRAHETG